MSMKFNELIRSGTNFEFVGKARTWFTISIILVVVSIAMLPINAATRGSMLNWTIDFKGGTEMILGFGKPVEAGPVRQALKEAGHDNADVSAWGGNKQGYLIRLPAFGAVSKQEADKVADELGKKFNDRQVLKAIWSGDTLYVRTTKPISQAEYSEFLKSIGLEMKPWTADQEKEYSTPLAATNEYNYQVPVHGLDRKIQQAMASKLGTEVEIKQVDAVGPKAGQELRNDGIKSMLYAIALIMLYIAFRFDFRYGPGTVAALLHDAILVVGIFAVFWVEFSLTTVAAVLTVIGYSMNDTIVVFDRIRENEHKLKDKKLDRVINISINETLSRTLLTSMTTFVTTLAMNLLGTGLVRNFAFAMNIGIIVGTYSSIFIAAPILLWLHQRYWSKRPIVTRRVSIESA
ncbi:MAG: protein translocase subunit SecF [Deltaproteobacteria bacterium]|nr:protein translocase subunit SecF [Deltaproteobacteria bacterium]